MPTERQIAEKRNARRCVMLKGQATFMPIHTCVEQSPKCLISNHEGPCAHDNCLMAYKKPEWFGLSVVDFYNKEQFSEFNFISSEYGATHIIPKNPNPGADDGFEGFRQSMNAITHIAGQCYFFHGNVG